MLQSEVYYQRQVVDPSYPTFSDDGLLLTDPTKVTKVLEADLVDPNTHPSPTIRKTYIKSEYASAYGVEIEKSSTNTAGSSLHA